MDRHFPTRRTFLQTASSAAALTLLPHRLASAAERNSRPAVALIGAGWQPDEQRQGRGIAIGRQAAQFADLVAVCDVDQVAAEFAQQAIRQALEPYVPLTPQLVTDYRSIIDRDDIDAVLIATPDHWHAKMAIEAMLSGKDVYCEKPVSVTIGEGRQIADTVEATGRVFQVGTQQRTEYEQRFLRAIAIVRDQRIGKLRRVRVGLDPGWQGGPFQTSEPPAELDWNRWLGPAPMTPYIPERTHRTFRWWYEYAGGNITDWGAHHVDIAQWAIDEQRGGPERVSGTARMNQPLHDGLPTRSDTYNTPIDFEVSCKFASGVEIVVDSGRNGITFEGEGGAFFVNRGTLEGRPIERLEHEPLTDDAVQRLVGRPLPRSHMHDFFDCLVTRQQPVSDIETHQRTLTTCHLANLALRLGRPLNWNAVEEKFIDDAQANSMLTRPYRASFEIET